MTSYKSIDKANDTIVSKVISFLRFPLIVAVVFIHSEPHIFITHDLDNYKIYEIIFFLLSKTVAGAAVPIFFFISGFLFFYHGDFSASQYIKKCKNRIHTLLIPYIIWNIIVYVILLLKQHLSSGDYNDTNVLTALSLNDFPRIFWNIRSGFYPMCAQFWFLRDLMVMVVLSPVIFHCLRIFRYYLLASLGFLWITNLWFDIPGLSLTALFFFSTGSYFGIIKKDFTVFLKPLMVPAIIIYPIICILAIYYRDESWVPYIHSICIILEIVLCITITTSLLSNNTWKVNNFLSESSFFIYAYHQVILAFVTKLLIITLTPSSGWGLLAIYILSAASIVLIGLVLYYLLRRFLPGVNKILTGGR